LRRSPSAIYEGILKSEEEHIDYLQTQQRLIATIGLTDYIQVQTQPNAANALTSQGD
jgi:bacterioferritin (cytochrome b1)